MSIHLWEALKLNHLFSPHKGLVIYSGGMDSTVLLYTLRELGIEIEAISFDYGQRHRRELQSAIDICEILSVNHKVVDMSFYAGLVPTSSQTSSDIDVPEGHYSHESMEATVVPNRNMVMLSLAIGRAIASDCKAVYYAAHAGDHPIYPDCRPTFVEAMKAAAHLCHKEPIEIGAPFIHERKEDIARLGHDLKVPFNLTWSCYKGGEKHCGKCGTCVERKEAFQLAGVPDPTEYEEG